MAEATDPRSRRQEVAHAQTRTDTHGLAAQNLRMYQAYTPPYHIPQQTVRVALPAEFMDVPKRVNILHHEVSNLISRVASLERQPTKPKPADDSLNHRLKDLEVRLEASGKRCEKLQNETQVAASQWLGKRMQRFDYFEERMQGFESLKEQVQRLEYPDAQMQRFENLEKQIGDLEKQVQRFQTLEKQIGYLEKQVQRFEYPDAQMQRLGQRCEQSHNETRLAIEDVRVSLTAIMKRLDGIEEKAAEDKPQFEGLKESVKNVTELISDFIHDQPSTGQKRKGDLITLPGRRTLRPRR